MCQGGRLDGISAHLLRQLLKSVIGLLGNQVSLLQPAFGTAGCAHPGEAAVTAENLHRLPVFYRPGLVENRRYLVAQERLRSRDISDLTLRAAAIAATQQAGGEQQEHAEMGAKIHGSILAVVGRQASDVSFSKS